MALAESPRIPVSVLRGYLTQAAARVGAQRSARAAHRQLRGS